MGCRFDVNSAHRLDALRGQGPGESSSDLDHPAVDCPSVGVLRGTITPLRWSPSMKGVGVDVAN